MRKIHIQNGLITVDDLDDSISTTNENYVQRRTVSATDFAEQFYHLANRPSGMLPPAVRWLSGDGCSMLAERPPFSLRIVDPHLQILVPWTVYAIDFNENMSRLNYFTVFTRPEQIYTLDDVLYAMPFAEYRSDFSFSMLNGPCSNALHFTERMTHTISPLYMLAEHQYDGRMADVTIAEALMSVVGYFWNIIAAGMYADNTLTDAERATLPEALQQSTFTEVFQRWHNVEYDALPLLQCAPIAKVNEIVNDLQSRSTLRTPASLTQRIDRAIQNISNQ